MSKFKIIAKALIVLPLIGFLCCLFATYGTGLFNGQSNAEIHENAASALGMRSEVVDVMDYNPLIRYKAQKDLVFSVEETKWNFG